jgi:PBSX family phage terminase large subunit
VGSGKTIALCADAILLGLQQPGSKILIARQTIPALKDTTEGEFVNLLMSRPEDAEEDDIPTLYDLCEIKKSAGHIANIIFPNGSEYLFRSLDDWRKLMGLNLAAFYIDEASEVSYDSYLALRTRLRQKKPLLAARRRGHKHITRRVAAICANPNGHDWMWEHFVKMPDEDVALRVKRRYFRSTSFDNPTLYDDDGTPGDFLNDLMTMPEVWVRRYVLCEFDSFAGQIYNFDYNHHVHRHFDPPADWERAMGLDWGLRNPTAIVWWARDPKTLKWHQYREWQSYDPTDPNARESAVTPTVHQVAATIKRLEAGESIRWRAIDPACANRQADSGKSVIYWFSKYGLHFRKGMKDYSSRINALNQFFMRNQLSISEQCPMSSIAIQQYRWEDISATAKHDGPERPLKKNDHLVNAAEYLATLFATPASQVEEKPVYTFASDVWATVKKQIANRNRYKPRSVL